MNRRVPSLFVILIFLISLGAFFSIGGWFRLFTIYYGAHIRSVTGIMAQGLICLAFGCWLFGMIADRTRKPAIINSILITVAALYMMLQSVMPEFFHKWLTVSSWAPLMIMALPLMIIGGSLPLLIRHFIKTINHAGLFMSRTLFAISCGVIVSVLLSVLILVPRFGIPSLFLASGISLLAALLLSLWSVINKKQKEVQVAANVRTNSSKTLIRYRKKKIVLETGTKLTRAMLYGSTFQAFSFASMIIIYLRILIRYNHLNPVFFYSVAFLVIFAGLALGSMVYGIIADKPANKYLTLAFLQIIAGIASLVSFGMLQFLGPDLYNEIHTSESFTSLTVQHILLDSLLAFIPSFVHGMSFPLAGRLYPKRLNYIGRTFGKLCSLVMLSLLAGLAITPLIMIPLIGTHASFIFLSTLVVLSGVYLIMRDSRLMRAFRFAFSLTALVLFIMLMVVLRVLNISKHNRIADGIYEGSTVSAHFVVNPDSSKSVYIDGDYYFGTGADELKNQVLPATIPLFIQPNMQKALIIGFNTGISASILDSYGVPEIQIAENSPEIVRLSSVAFSDENDDILTESSVHVRIIDPRALLSASTVKYDLILSGAEQTLLYPGRYTDDFYRMCSSVLTEQGIYCQVIPFSRIDSVSGMAFYRSCKTVFEQVSFWYLGATKVIMVGSNKSAVPEYCMLTERMEQLQSPWLEKAGIYNAESLLAHFIFSNQSFNESGLPENSDLKPQLQFRKVALEYEIKNRFYFPDFSDISGSVILSDSCEANEREIVKNVTEINRSMLRNASASSVEQLHDADSSASNGIPFRLYP